MATFTPEEVLDKFTRKVDCSTDCSMLERGIRRLPKEIYVQLTDGRATYKKDKNVKRYCQHMVSRRQGPISNLALVSINPLSALMHSEPTPSTSTVKPSTHLPDEIIRLILFHLTLADSDRSEDGIGSYRENCSLCHLKYLYDLCLVSKAWRGVATEILYSNLKLDLDGTCEYHWRGIPCGDGKAWWARRHSYLKERYLKPLLRTLTANPNLAQNFRSIEIDIHDHMVSDYKMLPLYTKIIALCPKITSIIGDPCIFFNPNYSFPRCQESIGKRLVNRLSGGRIRRRICDRILNVQQELQEAIAKHTAWESWRIDGCQQLHAPFLPTTWKNLKSLSIRDFHGKSADDNKCLPLDALESLESLSLTDMSLGVLNLISDNKLTTLTVERLNTCVPGSSSIPDLKELWAYLSRGSGPSSRLQRLDISIPAHQASTTEKWLSKTLSYVPNLLELKVSSYCRVEQDVIVLKKDRGLEELFLQQPFPGCVNLLKLWFMFPGWSHNHLLVKLLSREGAFPRLRNVVCFRSNVVVELEQEDDWSSLEMPGPSEAYTTSKEEGIRVENQLESELVRKRGMDRVYGDQSDWRMYFGCNEKVVYTRRLSR